MNKDLGKMWLSYGRTSGIALGFSISKYQTSLDLGFWYISLEY